MTEDVFVARVADWRLGSRGGRYCLRVLVDDVVLQEWAAKQIEDARLKHAFDKGNPLVCLRGLIIHKKVLVVLLGD